jgi:hypothetical protein
MDFARRLEFASESGEMILYGVRIGRRGAQTSSRVPFIQRHVRVPAARDRNKRGSQQAAHGLCREA